MMDTTSPHMPYELQQDALDVLEKVLVYFALGDIHDEEASRIVDDAVDILLRAGR